MAEVGYHIQGCELDSDARDRSRVSRRFGVIRDVRLTVSFD